LEAPYSKPISKPRSGHALRPLPCPQEHRDLVSDSPYEGAWQAMGSKKYIATKGNALVTNSVYPTAKGGYNSFVSTLYIIGNGFDLAHGLKTSYKDFFDYLRSTAEGRDLLENLSWFNDSIARQLQKEDQTDWCDFEDGFTGLNFDPAKMKNSIYGKTPEEIVVNVIAKTKAELRSFIMRSYYRAPIKPIMDLPKENALYINFNYTPTLEDVYGIPESRVLHIHGEAMRKEGLSLFGASMDGREIIFGGPKGNAINIPEAPIRGALIKDTNKAIKNLDTFLRGYPKEPITSIVVLRSSLSKADESYFCHLLKIFPRVRWVIGVRDEDKSGVQSRAANLKNLKEPAFVDIKKNSKLR